MERNIILYENLTLIFGIASAVFLIISIALYFIYDMKNVISRRLGLTEKQALRRMQANAEAAEKATKKRVRRVREMMSVTESNRNDAEGKQRDIAPTKKSDSILAALDAEQENEWLMREAMAAAASKNASYAGVSVDAETTQLSADTETTQLSADMETTQLHADAETSQLYVSDDIEWEESPDTTVLHEEAETGVLSSNAAVQTNKQFMLIRHIMLIHTDEVIA